MLLFWCSWFKYRFIKLDLVTVGKFCFRFSRVLGSVVDCVNVNPAGAWRFNHALRDAQNVWALTKVGTVLKLHENESVDVTHCHMNDFARRLVLTQRLKATRKRPIGYL